MRAFLSLAVLVFAGGCATPAPNVYARFYHGELKSALICLSSGVPPAGQVPQLKCGPPDVMIQLMQDAAADAGVKSDTSRSL